ncbi:Transglutaminase-like enzyme [Minicystis rosea]|nr:Transglutaminase-like enzyme [Minicystis rosea]
MRRASLLAFLLALPVLGCASFPSYRDLSPEAPPPFAASASSAEADAVIARFYGDGGASSSEIARALAAAPGHAGVHEIAGYAALLRADAHEAFGHFLAAAADRNAVATDLYLWEMQGAARTTSDHLRAQALLRQLAEQHPKPTTRQLATYELGRALALTGEREEAEQLVASLRFVEAWRVLGAFDNDQGKGFATAYPPEEPGPADRTYAGMRLPIRYRPLEARKIDGALPLGDSIAPAEAAVAYAETFVHADAARTVDLRLTTTSGVRVWHNGKQVAADEKIFHAWLDNVIVRVSLAAGWNRILVKSAHTAGPWRLAARFTDPASGAVLALQTAATATVPAGAAGAGQHVSPMGAIDRIADKNRKRFLLGRAWAREGHTARSSHYFDPLRRDVPKNPLVMYFSALGLREKGEAGKALDLLNEGTVKHPTSAAFFVERARFYETRKLWDKAQRDLTAAIAASPGARDAAWELARVHGGRGWTTDRCRELGKIVERWPDDVRALDELGACREDLQYYEEAERLRRRARALAPGYAPVIERLAWLAERRLDHDASLSWIKTLEGVDPTSMRAQLAEAEMHRRAGRRDASESALTRAKALSPDSPEPYERLASFAYEAQQKVEAERLYRQALERDPDNVSLAQRVSALSPSGPTPADKLVASADDIDRAVRSADKVNVHPGSHVVVLLDDEVTTVNPDGSSKRVITRVCQAVTTEGRDGLIQARLPSWGKVTVLEAYAVKKDGERQEVSSMTGGNVRFRGLEVGSIAVLQYVHYAPPPRFLPNEYVEQWRFQSVSAQTESSHFWLVLPKDRALNVEARGPIEQTSEIVGDQKVWSFRVKNVPPLVPEPNMAPSADALWMTMVSTVKDWDAFARWEMALLSDAFSTSTELDALAQKLTQGATTTQEKIDRLWAYVAQEIRYQQEYEDSIAGAKPHAAAVVRERGYGDCKDKAVLLIRLARAIGVDMRFALLRTRPFGKVLKQIPNQQFNHAIVYVPKQAGIEAPFFIDSTTNGLDVGNARTDDEGALSLVIDPTSGKWEFIPIPYQPVDLERVEHKVSVKLADPTKAPARDHLTSRGNAAATMRIALRNKEGAKKFHHGLVDRLFPGASVIEGKSESIEDIRRPAVADLELDLAGAIHPEEQAHRLDLPLLFPLSGTTALATREQPLVIPRGTQTFELDAELGEGQEASHLPDDFKVEHACFTVERRSEVKGHHVLVRTSYRNTCAEVAPAEYAGFRAAVQKAAAYAKDKIVFGPRGKAGAKPKKVAGK